MKKKMETNSNLPPKITKEAFTELINTYQTHSERLDKLLHTIDPYIIGYLDFLFVNSIRAFFTTEGEDWIFWWLYEKRSGNRRIEEWKCMMKTAKRFL